MLEWLVGMILIVAILFPDVCGKWWAHVLYAHDKAREKLWKEKTN